jgi:hypothetical protein
MTFNRGFERILDIIFTREKKNFSDDILFDSQLGKLNEDVS